jgi:hypothetical protein
MVNAKAEVKVKVKKIKEPSFPDGSGVFHLVPLTTPSQPNDDTPAAPKSES